MGELSDAQGSSPGFGIPGGIPGVALREGVPYQSLWLSVEQGVHNGMMLDDALFGCARNADAIIPSLDQFEFYSGGDPFAAKGIPSLDESFVVIHFRNLEGIDFPWLLAMLQGSFISHINTLVVPGGKMGLARNRWFCESDV